MAHSSFIAFYVPEKVENCKRCGLVNCHLNFSQYVSSIKITCIFPEACEFNIKH